MSHHSKHKKNKNKSIYFFYAFLTLVALGILYWSFVLQVNNVVVIADPQTLVPDGHSTATVRIVEQNRIGVEIPGSGARITCAVANGAGLAVLSYNADHTKAYVKAGMREGDVVLRVTSPELTFPWEITIRIRRPRA